MIKLIFYWNTKGGVLDYVEDGYPDVHLVEYLSSGIGFGKFKDWKWTIGSVTFLLEQLKEVRLIEDRSDSLKWMVGGDGKFSLWSCFRQF